MTTPRRIRWAVRAAVYLPLLLLLAVVLLGMRDPHPGGSSVEAAALFGTTSQGEHIELVLDRGAVKSAAGVFELTCSDDTTQRLAWRASGDGTTRLERDGSRVHVGHEWDHQSEGFWVHGEVVLDADLDGARVGAGIADVEMTWTDAAGAQTACDASDVRFEADED